MQCPKCQSTSIRRSRRCGPIEWLLKQIDRSVAMRVLPSAIVTADTFTKIPILQKPIGHVSLSLLVISNIEARLQNFGLFTHRPSDDAYGWPP